MGNGTPPMGATMTNTDQPVRTPRRPTRQRRAIAAVFDEFDGFRSAQEIHALLAAGGERVGLATVYRTLQSMAEAGVIDSLLAETGESVYRRCSSTHHHHLVCRQCGGAKEVSGPLVEKWTQAIARDHGYANLSHRIEIIGICADCQTNQD